MPFLLGFITLVLTVAVWLWRVRVAAEATHELADAVYKARGSYRQWKRNKGAVDAPFKTLDDPREAATVLMLLIARLDGDYTQAQLKSIQWEMQHGLKMGNATEESFQFCRWLSSLAPSTAKAIRLFAPLLNQRLDVDEKEELCQMLIRISNIEGEASPLQLEALQTLRRELHLPLKEICL